MTLITKAPVKLSSMYTLEKLTGDSAFAEIRSMVSTATTSEGENIYLKGEQKGEAVLSYATGMPYSYNINLESITKTTAYDVLNKEHFIVRRRKLSFSFLYNISSSQKKPSSFSLYNQSILFYSTPVDRWDYFSLGSGNPPISMVQFQRNYPASF